MGMISLTWADIGQMMETLAEQINVGDSRFLEDNDEPYDRELDFVYGVPRGGLIPAVFLSHKLGLPLRTREIGKRDLADEGGYGLWVDDIYDTGATFQQFVTGSLGELEKLYGYNGSMRQFAVLVSKETEENCPVGYVGLRVDASDWVVFPWETTESTHLNNDQRLTYPESARE